MSLKVPFTAIRSGRPQARLDVDNAVAEWGGTGSLSAPTDTLDKGTPPGEGGGPARSVVGPRSGLLRVPEVPGRSAMAG